MWFITWFITWLNQYFQSLGNGPDIFPDIVYGRYQDQNDSLKYVATNITKCVPVVKNGSFDLRGAGAYCCICQDEITQSSDCVMTNCRHIFHSKCFNEFVKNILKGCIQHIVNNEQFEPKILSCPLCRSEVTSLKINNNDDDDDLD
jgi:hypothetical protein